MQLASGHIAQPEPPKIGARRSHIRGQFMIEAVVLSVAGGVIGLAVGLVASAAIAQIGGWAFTGSVTTVALALGFSAAVGVVFGVGRP